MKFKFTDLKKTENYMGFESGIYCTYPNPKEDYLTSYDINSCDNDFYKETYKPATVPTYFDPRCRPWYQDVYKKKTTYIQKPYRFVTGEQGITSCVPLWVNEGKDFRGTYCFDMKPTSRDNQFLQKYYNISEKHVDYLIFDEDQAFKDGNFKESSFFKLCEELIFTKTSDGQDYTVIDIKLE